MRTAVGVVIALMSKLVPIVDSPDEKAILPPPVVAGSTHLSVMEDRIRCA
jgi:hypothetical protein